MEKKTIGGFIAALRKANGMTQKDLADRLNVSDKTVSRWERDEGTPDLSLIPVIAEIFGVTCDELLRGERRSPEERNAPQEDCYSTQKGEKQRQRLLNSALFQYRTQTYVSIGISCLGLIAALICNLVFLKAVLGFLCGTIFYVVSFACQAIFVNRVLLRVEDGGLDMESMSAFRRRIIALAERSIGTTVCFVGFTAPLLLVDAYMGLSADSMLLFGVIGAVAFLAVYAIICYFLNASFVKKGIYVLSEKESEVYYHNHRLKRICAIALSGLLLLTFVGHQAATTIWGPWSIMEGTTFQDYDSFIAFVEQKPDSPQNSNNREDSNTIWYDNLGNTISEEEAWERASEDKSAIWYDEFGNEITMEEAKHRTLKDVNGMVVCEYTEWYEGVVSVRYTPKDGTVLPITVCTYGDLHEAEDKVAVRNVVFGVGYCVEVIIAFLVYFKKRAK